MPYMQEERKVIEVLEGPEGPEGFKVYFMDARGNPGELDKELTSRMNELLKAQYTNATKSNVAMTTILNLLCKHKVI